MTPQDEPVDFFVGHLGHLTAIQEQSFSTFKVNLAQANLYTPSKDSNNLASHDEPTLLCVLRFIR
jgi:hypothetical protein